MSDALPWLGIVKTLHIVMVTSWFAGLFYLPRIYVNLAQVPADSKAERDRLVGMAQRLHRFMLPLAVLALLLGAVLWLGFGIGRGDHAGWLHAKLLLVLGAVGYHHHCGRLLRGYQQGRPSRSARWLRWYNELPVLLLLGIVALVVLKPF